MIDPIPVWLLASARLTSATLVAPLFAHREMPLWIRGAAALGLSIALLGHDCGTLVPMGTQPGSTSWPTQLGREVALGLVLGLALSLMIMAAKMIGQLLGQLAGFAWHGGETEETPLPSAKLLGYIALLVYISIGGVEFMVGAVLDSFRAIPVMTGLSGQSPLEGLTLILQQAFGLALWGVGPAVACWFAVQVACGLVQRLAPQLGFFQFGFQANLVCFWLSLLLTTIGVAWLFERELANVFERIVAIR